MKTATVPTIDLAASPLEAGSQSQEFTSIPFPVQEVHHGEEKQIPGCRALSKDEWEDLKPIIKHMYLDRKQTLKQLAEYLQDHHGFKPR
jgi:hypothetical protein